MFQNNLVTLWLDVYAAPIGVTIRLSANGGREIRSRDARSCDSIDPASMLREIFRRLAKLELVPLFKT